MDCIIALSVILLSSTISHETVLKIVQSSWKTITSKPKPKKKVTFCEVTQVVVFHPAPQYTNKKQISHKRQSIYQLARNTPRMNAWKRPIRT
mmetsp:Transcript_25281/g.58781  ORF Transcript_25281/g.58781 Transcript_25281/m.58781 type:complete len:92 (+) Transcript_25281:143-418(+)